MQWPDRASPMGPDDSIGFAGAGRGPVPGLPVFVRAFGAPLAPRDRTGIPVAMDMDFEQKIHAISEGWAAFMQEDLPGLTQGILTAMGAKGVTLSATRRRLKSVCASRPPRVGLGDQDEQIFGTL